MENIENIKINTVETPNTTNVDHYVGNGNGIGQEPDFLFEIYESSLVYWCILLAILGICYMCVIIYLKKMMGDKWKDGIVKWMLKWYLDKSEKQISITKDSEMVTSIFENVKKNMGID